ncbi:MAG: F0F1 ATP synthase subunit epsilon [Ilumatobacteraceae bacterium]
MEVRLVSPEKVLFTGEATQVITRTLGGGEIAFLPGHAPFLGALTECHTRISMADGSVLDVAVHGGFVQVAGNTVSILSDLAELGEHIDRPRHACEGERRGTAAQGARRRGRVGAVACACPPRRLRRRGRHRPRRPLTRSPLPSPNPNPK